MNGKTRAARKSADELAAGAVNGQDNEERFDADEEARIEAEVERRLDAKFEMAVEEAVEAARADASKFERHASNSDGPEVEIGKATDLAGILAEMREEFQGGDVAGVMAREFADRIEAAVGTGGVKGDTKANLATSMRDAVNAAKREAEASGVAWDRTNTEPAAKTFRVELALDVSDRLKLGILAARCNVTPERWLCDFLHGKFADFCASVFDKRHGNPMCDDALAQCAYEALYPTTLTAIVGASGGARLVFKPAVMA